MPHYKSRPHTCRKEEKSQQKKQRKQRMRQARAAAKERQLNRQMEEPLGEEIELKSPKPHPNEQQNTEKEIGLQTVDSLEKESKCPGLKSEENLVVWGKGSSQNNYRQEN